MANKPRLLILATPSVQDLALLFERIAGRKCTPEELDEIEQEVRKAEEDEDDFPLIMGEE